MIHKGFMAATERQQWEPLQVFPNTPNPGHQSIPGTKWALHKRYKRVFYLIKSLNLQNFRALPFQPHDAKIIKQNEAKQIGEQQAYHSGFDLLPIPVEWFGLLGLDCFQMSSKCPIMTPTFTFNSWRKMLFALWCYLFGVDIIKLFALIIGGGGS